MAVIRKDIQLEDRLFIYRRDRWRCLKCGSNKKLTIDHIIPLSKGGIDSVLNYQTLCNGCNHSKNNESIDYRQAPCRLVSNKK